MTLLTIVTLFVTGDNRDAEVSEQRAGEDRERVHRGVVARLRARALLRPGRALQGRPAHLALRDHGLLQQPQHARAHRRPQGLHFPDVQVRHDVK